MASRLLAAALALCAAQCALRPSAPDAFAFAVMGDTPYSAAEEEHFTSMMKHVDAERVDFVVHVGDFKAGSRSPCSDALFLSRKAQFDASAHPFVYTPGDNDWVDCRRATNGAFDPIERLAKLREIFFGDAYSLGVERMATSFQPGLPENRIWERGGVVFATINVQGSNNNRGFDRANDLEAEARDQANLAWLAEAEARATRAAGLAVFTQASLWDADAPTYFAYEKALVDIAMRLGKPVLFVHGDTHRYRADTPFKDRNGTSVTNPSRLEVYGSPFVGWIKVDVDRARPDVFTIEPRLAAVVPPLR
jgi:hypothetical protein